MTTYLWVKLVHILSATVLFGTGLGTAFFMLKAYRSGNEEAMRLASKHVVTADWLFTTPAVAIQLITGIWLTVILGIPFDSPWFKAVLTLYVFVGACWIPVVRIQIRIRELAAKGPGVASCRRLMRIWIALGVPAFTAVVIIFFLMVSKLGAYS